MSTARRTTAPAPPKQAGPVIRGSQVIQRWFYYYWQKLQLPAQELCRVAITQDRQEFMRWTGKRLNPMVLGCYCYLPVPRASAQQSNKSRVQGYASSRAPIKTTVQPRPGNHKPPLSVSPYMQTQSIEVPLVT